MFADRRRHARFAMDLGDHVAGDLVARRLLAVERLRVHRVLQPVRARDAAERLDRLRAVAFVLRHRDVAGAQVHHAGGDELPQSLVESRHLQQRRQRSRVAVAVILLGDLERVHVLALGAAEIAERIAAVGGLAEQRQLLQVEQAVGAAAHGERAVEELGGRSCARRARRRRRRDRRAARSGGARRCPASTRGARATCCSWLRPRGSRRAGTGSRRGCCRRSATRGRARHPPRTARPRAWHRAVPRRSAPLRRAGGTARRPPCASPGRGS